MQKLLPLLLLLLIALLCPARSLAQGAIAGQSCGTSGLSSFNPTTGQALQCQGNPLVWVCTSNCGGGGGLTQVATLPATCTPGTTQPVSLSTYGVFRCVATNVWAPDDPQQAVSPLAYGAKWDVKAVMDASFTNTSNVVTCPNADCNFTSSDLGKIIFGTNGPGALTTGCNGGQCGQVILPQGFICTINSATSINVGLTFPGCAADNANTTCTAPTYPSTCTLVWGTQDDSTAINAAAAAAWTGNSCKTLEFPAGMAFFTVPSGGLLHVTTTQGTPCGGNLLVDATQQGAQVAGQGSGNSILVPLPSTNFANCTGGNSGTACIAGPPNWFAHDWGIWGFGQADATTTHANNLIEFYGGQGCTTGAIWNMSFAGWEDASASSQGFVLTAVCGTAYATNVVSEGFGNSNCYLANGSSPQGFPTTVSGLDCFGSGGAGVSGSASLIIGGGAVNSTGSSYWGVNNSSSSTAAVKILGGVYNSFGDLVQGATSAASNNFAIWQTTTSTVNLSGSTVTGNNSGGTGNSFVFFCAAGTCNINAYSSVITAQGSKMAMFLKTGGTLNFFDACGNTLTQGGVTNVLNNVYGSCSITGTNITAAKLVLSGGWGASAAWTSLTGATQSVQGTITNTGAGQAANPTITYTFPTPYILAPSFCSAYQVGGTQAITAATEFLTPSALTNTGVTFTYNGTPTANLTEVIQILCTNQ